MLEGRIHRFKIGYKTASDLFGIHYREIDPNSFEGRLAVQRDEAVFHGYNKWELIGYLSCVAWNFVKHPLETYRLCTKDIESPQEKKKT